MPQQVCELSKGWRRIPAAPTMPATG